MLKKQERRSQQPKKTVVSPRVSSSASCIFCKKMAQPDRPSFGPLLLKALYTKYSSSQNYYYCRDVNDILDDRSTPAVATYRDIEHFIEEEEYLKRWYYRRENSSKMHQLTEYYKYHRDIPRLFMTGVCATIHKFHDKRRRLEYAKIKHQLGIANDDRIQSESTHPHYKKDNGNSRDCSVKQLQYMLRGMDLTAKQNTQQSCTIMLRDVLNSIIKRNGFDESFDKSQAFGLSESVLAPKKKPVAKPSIPQINVEAINKLMMASHHVSPTQKQSPKPVLTKKPPPQQKVPQRISGAQTTRESLSTKNSKPPQLVKNVQPPLTSRNNPTYKLPVTASIQKLMIPLVQKQLQQQLLELQNRAKKLTQKPELTLKSELGSPGHKKTISVQQHNSHFVQPVFQSIPIATRVAAQKSTQLFQNHSSRVQENLARSQPSSPGRPPSRNNDISIKFNGAKLSYPKARVPSVYTINQNNIVNIYLDEKLKNGIISSRGSSPLKLPTRKILDCENPFKMRKP